MSDQIKGEFKETLKNGLSFNDTENNTLSDIKENVKDNNLMNDSNISTILGDIKYKLEKWELKYESNVFTPDGSRKNREYDLSEINNISNQVDKLKNGISGELSKYIFTIDGYASAVFSGTEEDANKYLSDYTDLYNSLNNNPKSLSIFSNIQNPINIGTVSDYKEKGNTALANYRALILFKSFVDKGLITSSTDDKKIIINVTINAVDNDGKDLYGSKFTAEKQEPGIDAGLINKFTQDKEFIEKNLNALNMSGLNMKVNQSFELANRSDENFSMKSINKNDKYGINEDKVIFAQDFETRIINGEKKFLDTDFRISKEYIKGNKEFQYKIVNSNGEDVNYTISGNIVLDSNGNQVDGLEFYSYPEKEKKSPVLINNNLNLNDEGNIVDKRNGNNITWEYNKNALSGKNYIKTIGTIQSDGTINDPNGSVINGLEIYNNSGEKIIINTNTKDGKDQYVYDQEKLFNSILDYKLGNEVKSNVIDRDFKGFDYSDFKVREVLPIVEGFQNIEYFKENTKDQLLTTDGKIIKETPNEFESNIDKLKPIPYPALKEKLYHFNTDMLAKEIHEGFQIENITTDLSNQYEITNVTGTDSVGKQKTIYLFGTWDNYVKENLISKGDINIAGSDYSYLNNKDKFDNFYKDYAKNILKLPIK